MPTDFDQILDHFKAPYHRGRLPEATCAHSMRLATCGDWINLQLLIEHDRVQQAWFEGQGCTISQAAASILCQHIESRPLEELSTFTPEQMLNLLGIPLSPYRKQCGLLAYRALMAMDW